MPRKKKRYSFCNDPYYSDISWISKDCLLIDSPHKNRSIAVKKNDRNTEINMEEEALNEIFGFFDDFTKDKSIQTSFAISKQDEKEEDNILQVQRNQLKWTKELSKLCHLSKNLYNHANYYVRKLFFYKQGKINKLGKGRGKKLKNVVMFSEHYKKLPAQTADQVLRYLIRNWKSYLEAVNKWFQVPFRFPGGKKPRIPGYKPSKGEFPVIFPAQNLRYSGYRKHFKDTNLVQQWTDKDGNFHSKTTSEIMFPKKAGINPIRFRIDVNGLKLDLDTIKEFRIVPRGNHYIFEVVYEKKIENMRYDSRRAIGVDLGVNNLLTIANNFGKHPVIVKGKRIKHVNWLGNKQDAKIKKIFYEKLDEKLLHFLDSCLYDDDRASIVKTFNYFLEDRLWDENVNKGILHHINVVLSINGKLKESSKEYYRNDDTKVMLDLDLALLGEVQVQEIEYFVEEVTKFILEYEKIRIRNWKNRNNRVQDQIHKASRYLIEYCKKYNVGRIVIGYNEGWKQDVKLGKKSTQNFIYIPFLKLVKKIEYKARLIGIKVERINEDHTSKCSALDFESIGHHNTYIGKRIIRGLYRSMSGLYINSDVNGAFNILRAGIEGSLDEYRYNKKNRRLMLLSPVSMII